MLICGKPILFGKTGDTLQNPGFGNTRGPYEGSSETLGPFFKRILPDLMSIGFRTIKKAQGSERGAAKNFSRNFSKWAVFVARGGSFC